MPNKNMLNNNCSNFNFLSCFTCYILTFTNIFIFSVDQQRAQRLGLRAGLAARRPPGVRLQRRSSKAVGHPDLSAPWRDQGPQLAHQRSGHKLHLHLFGLQVRTTFCPSGEKLSTL